MRHMFSWKNLEVRKNQVERFEPKLEIFWSFKITIKTFQLQTFQPESFQVVDCILDKGPAFGRNFCGPQWPSWFFGGHPDSG